MSFVRNVCALLSTLFFDVLSNLIQHWTWLLHNSHVTLTSRVRIGSMYISRRKDNPKSRRTHSRRWTEMRNTSCVARAEMKYGCLLRAIRGSIKGRIKRKAVVEVFSAAIKPCLSRGFTSGLSRALSITHRRWSLVRSRMFSWALFSSINRQKSTNQRRTKRETDVSNGAEPLLPLKFINAQIEITGELADLRSTVTRSYLPNTKLRLWDPRWGDWSRSRAIYKRRCVFKRRAELISASGVARVWTNRSFYMCSCLVFIARDCQRHITVIG